MNRKSSSKQKRDFSSPLDENKELINLLSNEILKYSELNVTFRTRIAFAFWIGPFVVLGALLIAAKDGAEFVIFEINSYAFYLFVGIVISYLAMGFLGGMIERANYSYCDRLRKIIQELSLHPVSSNILEKYRFGVADSLVGKNDFDSNDVKKLTISNFLSHMLHLLSSKMLIAYSFAYIVMILQAFLLAGIIYLSVTLNNTHPNTDQDVWQINIKLSK
ncbi:hypothetical protein [Gimesia maris]|uniref:hypothetical protein n=1 Tax=Gimesia maris TaxID=122 RepID=UPI003A8EC232